MSQVETTRVTAMDDRDNDGEKKPKNRRPANTAFRQQRLKAWQPILTPKSVLPLFFIVGIIFAPLGGILLWASAQVQEIEINYSDCAQNAPIYPSMAQIPDKVTATFKSTKPTSLPQWTRQVINRTKVQGSTTSCSIIFDIPEPIGPPVFLYYRLTNFYQNHRRYVSSLDMDQLKGVAVDNNTIKSSACDPLTLDGATGKAYYPCGLIANSIFNDTINSPVLINNDTYFMTDNGIAWPSDKELIQQTKYNQWQVVPPPNWRNQYPNGYTNDNPIPNLHEDEAFMVWLRTAGLPTFSKLSRRNDTTAMASGTYQLDIYDYFPVTEYGGTKSILISTRTVMGGKNPFMGIAYVVVGGICVVLGAVFTVAHLIRPRKLGDHTYLTWNNEQPSAGVSTGRDNRFG
jgi:hypothetical protein